MTAHQCEAYNVVNVTSSLDERRCMGEAGLFVFDASTGTRRLCSSHAESYKKVGFELRKARDYECSTYTSDAVRCHIKDKYQTYLDRLMVNQPATWKCDDRTESTFILTQWLIDEMTLLSDNDVDRRAMLWYFDRKTRAEDDLYALAAKVMNDFVAGRIDNYRGK